MEPPKFRSLYIFMNKNAHFIILVSFCRPHSDLLFMTNVPSSLVLLSMYKDSEIYHCILNFCLSNTIVLNFWKGPKLLVVIISYLYLLERKLLQRDVNEQQWAGMSSQRDLVGSRWQYWNFMYNWFKKPNLLVILDNSST